MTKSRSPLWFGALAAMVCAGAVACSGSGTPPKDGSSATEDSMSEPDPSSNSGDNDVDQDFSDGDDGETGDAQSSSGDARPPKSGRAEDEDYDINHRDCDALAQAYHNAWLNDELPTLAKKKLKQKQHDAAEEQLRQAADGAREQWYTQCEGIVGTAFLRSRLVCAMKAKSIQRFNDCWDGKVE